MLSDFYVDFGEAGIESLYNRPVGEAVAKKNGLSVVAIWISRKKN